jgi:hypothetical protein
MMLLGLTRSLALAPFGPNGHNSRTSRGHRAGFATPGAGSFAALTCAMAHAMEVAS